MTTLFAAYSAQMTAVLSVTNVVMPFENVQGMYRDTDFKVGSVKDTAFDSLFDVRSFHHISTTSTKHYFTDFLKYQNQYLILCFNLDTK